MSSEKPSNRPSSNPGASELEKSEERYRRLVETTDTGYVILDAKGVVIDANQEYARLSGHSEILEVIGRSVLEWTAKEDLEKNLAAVDACMKTGKIRNLEISYVNAAGGRTPVEINATVVPADGAPRILSLCRDISARKKAEQAVASESAFNQLVIESAGEGICVCHEVEIEPYVNFTVWNRSMVAMTGYSMEEINRLGWYQSMYPDPAVRNRAIERMQRMRTGDNLQGEEWEITRADRRKRRILISTRLVETGDGRAHVLAVMNDISEHKTAEEALRDSEMIYRSIIESSPMGMHLYALEPDGRLVFIGANPAADAILGVDNSVFIGKTIEEAFPPLAATEVPARYRETAKNGVLWQTEQIDYAEGAINGAFHVVAFNIGKNKMAAMFLDITKRKRAEQMLADEKERLAVTLRSIGDGVITTDTAGRVMIMNNVAEALTGWTQKEAEGKPLADVFNIINEQSRIPCQNPAEQAIASGTAIELANHTILISRDGTERIIADSGSPIKDRDGHIIGVVLVFRDQTEKQRFLDAAQKSQRLESLGVLAGGIAHDFNNLLTGIFGYVDLARSVSREKEVQHHLCSIMDSMDRARGLTQQLLTFSKGGKPAKKAGPLFPFIQEAVSFSLSGSSISCSFEIEEDLRSSSFDRDQIGQVIDNIVINAKQAMPLGGTIEVSAKNLRFGEKEHPVLAKGKYVRVSIRDHGIGIPKEIISRIFDPFFTTKTSGHGLGLATCYSIINRHGGVIEVESEPGKGSTFHVVLPATTGPVLPVENKAYKKHKGSGTIIVMDDEKSIRDTFTTMLGILGYSVICATNGKDVVECFRDAQKKDRKIAGIILDLTIRGGMGGKDASVEIRKLDAGIPVFVASGYADDPVMANPGKYGISGSIKKPFTMAELSDLLERTLKARLERGRIDE